MKKSISLLICLLFIVQINKLCSSEALLIDNVQVDIIAHRGAAGIAPENTLAAIDSAISLGAKFIEIDIQRSKDKVLVLMHDKTVNRTTNGKGKVAELSWKKLKKLDAGTSFSDKFEQESVPTLKEAIKRIKLSSSTLAIEVKNPNKFPGIAKDLLSMIKKLEAKEQVIVISFDIDFLRELRAKDSAIRLGGLYLYPPADNDLAWMEVISMYYKSCFMLKGRLEDLRMQGISLWAWTVNDQADVGELAKLGIKGIVTDYPDLLEGD